MTPEEQRALAIECGASYSLTEILEKIEFALSDEELAVYTAAVEANERERCASHCDEKWGAFTIANSIRSLINE